MAASKLPRLLGVVGAGQMGSGIAQVAATKGLEVLLCDNSKASLEKGVDAITKSLGRIVRKGGLLQEDADKAINQIKCVDDLDGLADVDYVIEAVTENEPLKRAIFQRLDLVWGRDAFTRLLMYYFLVSLSALSMACIAAQIAKPDTILASNTSSISITRIASATQRPAQVIGMHFMNPVPLMPLVEIIRGIGTTDEVFHASRSLCELLGKQVCLSQDRPGFIVNRILMPMINEAFYALMEGVGTAEDIDRGMKLGTNQPMGPLQLADFIGLDTCLAIMRVLYEGLADCKYRPCPLLVQYVDAGWLGKKTFKGVYTYEQPQ